LIAVGLLIAVCSGLVLAQAPAVGTKTDPIIGTWKLNPEKSNPKPSPGTVSVRRYELRPDGFMTTIIVGVTPQGDPSFTQTTWKYDGKDYPQYTQGSLAELSAKGVKPGTDASRAIDAYTSELTQKDNTGKVTFAGRTRVVSKDGKTLTIKGQAANTVAVYDRVH
jgi:hypothetical protein